jgi:hypothetical protein
MPKTPPAEPRRNFAEWTPSLLLRRILVDVDLDALAAADLDVNARAFIVGRRGRIHVNIDRWFFDDGRLFYDGPRLATERKRQQSSRQRKKQFRSHVCLRLVPDRSRNKVERR